MRVIIEPDYQALSQWAANYVASKINAANPTPEKPFVLGCPTGSSPLGMYKALIELNKQGKVSFQNVVTFNMDEYVGLPEDHPESYHTFMWKNFFNHIDIKKENVHILNGNAEDLEAECANYEKQIAEIGGIDPTPAGASSRIQSKPSRACVMSRSNASVSTASALSVTGAVSMERFPIVGCCDAC